MTAIDWRGAVWCSTAQYSLTASITVLETVINRRTREEGFKALGVWITFDGHFTKELAEESARRRFYALRQLLCDNNVALKYRLRLLTSCVVSSMYWCAGSCTLTRTQCAHLRAVQDAEKDNRCTETPCWNCRGILPAISHGVDTLHGSRREIRKGKQASYFCTKIGCGFEV